MSDYQVFTDEARIAKAKLMERLKGKVDASYGLRDLHGSQGDGYAVVVMLQSYRNESLIPEEIDGVKVISTFIGKLIAL